MESLPAIITQLGITVDTLKSLHDELQNTVDDSNSGSVKADVLLRMSQQLQKVGLQKVGVRLLEKAVSLCREDDKLRARVIFEKEHQDKQVLIMNQLHSPFSSIPVEPLRLICEQLGRGSSSVFAVSQVCRTWRNITLETPSLWRDLTIKKTDHNPHLKAQAFVLRSGTYGLRSINIDMTFSWDNPPKHPKRVSPRNYGKSTFQQILCTIDQTTRKLGNNIVHNLDVLRYFSKNSWHGFDMVYLIRFLLRSWIQPRIVKIETEDKTADWGWYHAVPMLPAFNSRLAEFHLDGRAQVIWKFTPSPGVAPGGSDSTWLSSKLISLKMSNIGPKKKRDPDMWWMSSRGDDLANLAHGLHRAALAYPTFTQGWRGNVDLLNELVGPGDVEHPSAHVDMILDSWTSGSRRNYEAAVVPEGEKRLLPELKELVLGVLDLDFLNRLEVPKLERLVVATPLWFDWKGGQLMRAWEQHIIVFLERIGGSLRVFDVGRLNIPDHQYLERLPQLTPNLEALCIRYNTDLRSKEKTHPNLQRWIDVGEKVHLEEGILKQLGGAWVED